jgi:plasmid stability protein
MQYTLRNVPKKLDAALRRRAKQDGKSLNQVAVETLEQAMGVAKQPRRIGRDLDFLIGSMGPDPAFDKAVEAQRQIDPEMWR